MSEPPRKRASGRPSRLPAASDASPALRRLAAADEVLQVMFWLHGEGLADAVGPADLAIWLDLPPAEIEPLLETLAARGLLAAAPGGAGWRLTDTGSHEGGRRFADEFADITRPGHGECGDPDCDCQRSGDPADCAHRAHAHG